MPGKQQYRSKIADADFDERIAADFDVRAVSRLDSDVSVGRATWNEEHGGKSKARFKPWQQRRCDDVSSNW